jgi:hypothetical protein
LSPEYRQLSTAIADPSLFGSCAEPMRPDEMTTAMSKINRVDRIAQQT